MTDIQHAGILGMHWGKRKLHTSSVPSEDHNKTKKLKKKKTSEMSNTELKELTTRLQLEKQYKELTKSQTSEGKKFVMEALREVGKEAFKNVIKTGAKSATKGIVKSAKEGYASGGIKR